MSTNPTFPIDTFRDAAHELRRPFGAKALKWKVQTQWPKSATPTGGLIVCYVDRGLVIDRLNMVVPHLWSPEFTELERGHMKCKLTVDGISREDVGEGGTLKARYSDSLKRAAVHFGIGVSLTRIPQSRLYVKDGTLKVWGQEGKEHLDITQGGLDYLRGRYEDWLEQVGVTAFGEPLEHGDLGDAQGDDEVENIIDDSSAVDLYVSLSEAGLTLRQQIGLVNAAGGTIRPGAADKEIAAAVATLTDDQAKKLDELIAQRMGAET